MRELASDGDVVAIIGPLLSSVSEAAAAVAEDEGVPLLALSSREEVAAARPHVLRLRTTPRDEVDYLVSYAIDDIGARRFAILYPSDNYGRGMRDRFWQAVDAHSAWVVAVAGYDPEATDFAEPIRSLVGYDLLTADERKALDERSEALRKARRLPPEEAAELRETLYSEPGPEGDPLPPVVDFDAIFIPDSHDNVVLIAPQLAFHEVTGVRLLGTGDWMHPDLLRIARRHVRGAVIAAPFHAESEFAFVARFVDDYAQTFGAEPDLFAAHGFDAANLLLTQLAANRTTRDELLDGVLRTRGYPGVSGVTTVLPDGNARKRPYLLGVKGGQIVPLD